MVVMPEIPRFAEPRQILDLCGGFYECPKDANGKRLGPLVAYTARDESGLQYVGDVYANFATVEQWPKILATAVASELAYLLPRYIGHGARAYCGAPEGGKTLSAVLVADTNVFMGRNIYPEKVVVTPKTPTSREVTRLEFTGRHEPHKGEQVVIVEDICNNFSTTAQLIEEIERFGAMVVAIACFLNRSPTVRKFFVLEGTKRSIPVIALWNEPMAEYRQDDPEVVDDIRAGNVAWKPKPEWPRLMKARESVAA